MKIEKDNGQKMSIDDVIEMLNKAFEADPEAVHAVVCNRVPCNEEFANDPYIVCDTSNVLEGPPRFTVGALGLLNGVLGFLMDEVVATKWSGEDEYGKTKFLGFTKYAKQAS